MAQDGYYPLRVASNREGSGICFHRRATELGKCLSWILDYVVGKVSGSIRRWSKGWVLQPRKGDVVDATERGIWHCPSPPDRKLADILVRMLTANVWVQLSKHFGEGYPLSPADKYHLVYRLMGCKGKEN